MPKPISLKQWYEINEELAALYKKFKTSDMSFDEYLNKSDKISKDLKQARLCFDSLIKYRTGLKKINPNYALKTIRHEGERARIARRIGKQLNIKIKVSYVLELLDYGDAGIGAGPRINFPDLEKLLNYSKEKYIIFMDAVIGEHSNPSDGDKKYM
ncbi:MAG: hypothetical protein V1867_07440 [Candidatus Falkowbacteria bacterium]